MRETVTILSGDGILGLLDLAAYEAEVDWDRFDPDLIDHFDRELAAGHGVVWQASPLGGDEYQVVFTDEPSGAKSHRELTAGITAIGGRLQLASYEAITAAADGAALPVSWEADAVVDVPAGPLAVTIRQLFDPLAATAAGDGPSFEIVLTPGTRTATGERYWRDDDAADAGTDGPDIVEERPSRGMAALFEAVAAVDGAPLFESAEGEVGVYAAAIGADIRNAAVARAVALLGEPTDWAAQYFDLDQPGWQQVIVERSGAVVGFASDGRVNEISVRMRPLGDLPDRQAHHPDPAAVLRNGALTRAAFRAAYPEWTEAPRGADCAIVGSATILALYRSERDAAGDELIGTVILRPSA
ncbi:hypothetical protein [Microbacterium sp. NPDC057650]|uniref:hypothetical protein n=1 Tax=unclassified Microbacterium TaxID=2609290 RepID=UPI00366F6A6C